LYYAAAAVKALSEKGIVHRDLKPQNILLCHDGRQNPQPPDITLKIGTSIVVCSCYFKPVNLKMIILLTIDALLSVILYVEKCCSLMLVLY